MSSSSQVHSAAERTELYWDFAAQALKLAQSAPTLDIRANYLSLAQCWTTLAERTDRIGHEPFDHSGEPDASEVSDNTSQRL